MEEQSLVQSINVEMRCIGCGQLGHQLVTLFPIGTLIIICHLNLNSTCISILYNSQQTHNSSLFNFMLLDNYLSFSFLTIIWYTFYNMELYSKSSVLNISYIVYDSNL